MTASSLKEHVVSATSLLNIDKALSKYGLDPVHELSTLGFQPSDFNRPELRVPNWRIAEILQHCIQITHCEHFVLELVQMQTPALDSYLGMLLRTAPTLEDAIRLATHELYLHVEGIFWSFKREGKYAYVSWSLDAQKLEPNHRSLLAELGIAQGWFFLRNQCQRPVRLDTVLFVRKSPTDKRPYRRFFNAPVQFDCELDQLRFAAAQLELPMSRTDPYLHRAIRELITLRNAHITRPALTEEVCSIIRMLLPQGNCTIERVARYLARDKRTLQRQLRDESDVTFQGLLQQERLHLVQTYLRESQKSITQIAYATGYKEPGNMARAFRKRFNCTPQQWRERYHLNVLAPGATSD